MAEQCFKREHTEEVQEKTQSVASVEQVAQQTSGQGNAQKKTQEELALEAGYYACCFRSH